MKKTFYILSLVATSLVTLVACNEDFSSIDSAVTGNQNFVSSVDNFPVLAYTQPLGPVQSNNLSSNLLGVYEDPLYGQTVAKVVTQMLPSSTGFNPDFKYYPKIESVILTIPYSSRITNTSSEGFNFYELDSVYGNDPIKLSVYRNNFFLRDLNPDSGLSEIQNFYSDDNNPEIIDFENNHLGELLYTNNDLNFSSNAVTVDDGTNLSPRLRVNITVGQTPEETQANIAYWENLLFANQGNEVLSNANNFKDFFRGLYFKAEPKDGKGSMIMLNFASTEANITVNYTAQNATDYSDNDGDGIPAFADYTPNGDSTFNGVDSDGDDINDAADVDLVTENAMDLNNDGIDDNFSRENLTYTLLFSGNRVNLLNNNFTINQGNPTTGDDKLYLKGGEGAMGIIELFKGNVTDQEGNIYTAEEFLNAFYKNENGNPIRLVNQAELIVHVDKNTINGAIDVDEPERLYLYDLDNNRPLIDFSIDNTTNNEYPLISKNYFSSLLKVDSNGTGEKYVFRITDHINNILRGETENVKLGLVATTNINSTANADVIEDPSAPFPADTEITIPVGAVLSPKGTVLHGSTEAVMADKRIQLKIYYSEPNN